MCARPVPTAGDRGKEHHQHVIAEIPLKDPLAWMSPARRRFLFRQPNNKEEGSSSPSLDDGAPPPTATPHWYVGAPKDTSVPPLLADSIKQDYESLCSKLPRLPPSMGMCMVCPPPPPAPSSFSRRLSGSPAGATRRRSKPVVTTITTNEKNEGDTSPGKSSTPSRSDKDTASPSPSMCFSPTKSDEFQMEFLSAPIAGVSLFERRHTTPKKPVRSTSATIGRKRRSDLFRSKHYPVPKPPPGTPLEHLPTRRQNQIQQVSQRIELNEVNRWKLKNGLLDKTLLLSSECHLPAKGQQSKSLGNPYAIPQTESRSFGSHRGNISSAISPLNKEQLQEAQNRSPQTSNVQR